jgi:hypothetical protein
MLPPPLPHEIRPDPLFTFKRRTIRWILCAAAALLLSSTIVAYECGFHDGVGSANPMRTIAEKKPEAGNNEAPHAALIPASSSEKPAHLLTRAEFRRKLFALLGGAPPRDGKASALILAYGEPDKAWTIERAEQATGRGNAPPGVPVINPIYHNSYEHLYWNCKDGAVELEADADNDLRDLKDRGEDAVTIRKLFDQPN